MNRLTQLLNAGWESVKSVKGGDEYFIKEGCTIQRGRVLTTNHTFDEAWHKEFGNQ